MKLITKQRGFLLIGLLLAFICSTVSCSQSDKHFAEYQVELQQASEIAIESMNQISDALRDPESDVNMVTFGKRLFEITLIHANTLKYIDSRPKYAELHSELWDDGVPPNLAWTIPEDEYEEIQYEGYLNDYISFHDWVVEKLARRLQ